MKYKVFVYGTLKKGFRLHSYLEHSKYLGEGFIENYEMFNVGWYPAIVKGSGKVYGELYEVDEETLKILDIVEDEGNLYRRIEENIYFNGEKIRAFIYVYLDDVLNLEKIKTGKFGEIKNNGKG